MVGLIGRCGKMGVEASSWIEAAPDMELVASIDRGDDWSPLAEAQVALEVTAAGNGDAHGLRLLEMGVRPVIGTSGVTPSQVAGLDATARELGLGGAVIPNFSVLVVLLQRLARAAAEHLPEANIVEAHSPSKLDAPSGTATHTASLLSIGPTDVHSLRINGALALHELRMRSSTDALLIRHESLSRDCFREGALMSLRYAAHAEGIAHGLEAVMGEACKVRQSV